MNVKNSNDIFREIRLRDSTLSLPLLQLIFSQLAPPNNEGLYHSASINILQFLKDLSIRQPSRDALTVEAMARTPPWDQLRYHMRTFHS
jgi:hypothetical protein